jgi:hypothetical protein
MGQRIGMPVIERMIVHDRNKMMFGHCWLTIVLLVCTSSCVSAHARIRNIEFAPGATSLQIEDQLQGLHDEREFAFHADAETRVTIELAAPGAIRGVLVYPSGKQEGGPGGVILNHKLTETGEYRLRVRESPMGETWQGPFSLRVYIVP